MKSQQSRFQSIRSILFLALAISGFVASAIAAPSDLDPTFGSGGRIVSPIGKFSADYGYATALQSDGKVIVAGRTSTGDYTGFMVARINTDGSLDTSFGDKGFAGKKFFAAGYALAVAIQSDGKIVAGGHTIDQTLFGFYTVFTLVRFNTDGTVDDTFGGGFAQAQVGRDYSWVTSLAIQTDGKIVAAGFTYTLVSSQPKDFAVARFNPDGTIDNSFGIAGTVLAGFSSPSTRANSVVIQNNGKIVVGGNSNFSFQLIRLNSDGSFDTGFNGSGRVSTRIDQRSDLSALFLQNDGKIIAAGKSYGVTGGDVALARYNSDGSLDSFFGAGGIVMTDINNKQEGASAVNVRIDGKIVVGGTTTQSASAESSNFLAIRYNSNGSLDNSFGDGGKAVTDVSPTEDSANALVIQSDGKVLLVGYSFLQNYDVVMIRYNVDGSLDASFNDDGIYVIEFRNAADFIFDTAIQPDGKIIAVGYGFDGVIRDITVVRYNSNGTLDASFGDNGIVYASLGSFYSRAASVLLQPDGKIIVGGTINAFVSNSDFVVLRYNPDGSLDSTFGPAGVVTIPVGNNTDVLFDLALQSDGKIVAVGQGRRTSNYNFAVVRLSSDGSLDSSFGTNGKVLTAAAPMTSSAGSVAVGNDGKIIVVGYGSGFVGTGTDFVAVRYNSDGTLDTSFDADGKVNTTFNGSSPDGADAVIVQGDGKIVAAGYSDSNFALTRYNTDGSLDASFDTDGRVTMFVAPTNNSNFYDLTIQPNGKIVAVGSGFFSNNFDSVIARYNADGSPDNSFGNGGIIVTTTAGDDEFYGVSLQRDGKIVAAGYSSNQFYAADFTLLRYLGDASVKSRKRVRFIF